MKQFIKGQRLYFSRLFTWDSAVKPRCFSKSVRTMKGSTIRSSAEEKDPVCLLLRGSEQALFLNPRGVFFLTLLQSARHILTPLGSFVTWLLLLSSSNLGSSLFIYFSGYGFCLFSAFPNKKKVMRSFLSPRIAKRRVRRLSGIVCFVCVCVFSHLLHL